MMRNDWNNMRAAAEDVIASGLYNLNTPYETIFREKGENCSESVLELQCTSTTALPGSNDIGSQYAQVQGCRGAGEWNLGWGQHTATQLLADAFEEGDPGKMKLCCISSEQEKTHRPFLPTSLMVKSRLPMPT